MIKPNRTLIILTPGFPKDETDSTCLPMQQQLVRHIKKADNMLRIVVLSFQYPYIRSKYKWQGIPVISFNGRNRPGIARMLLRYQIMKTLKRIRATHPPISGLLSFWCGECALVGKHFADQNKMKHFCWIFGQDAGLQNKYPGRIKPRGTELIALSDFLADEFEKNHKVRPAHIIPAGTDSSLFKEDISTRNIDILGVGSLISLKRWDIFLEIISKLKRNYPSLKAVMIGEGPERKNLEIIIRRENLAGNVELMGELPYEEVLVTMQRARLLLHPSSYEGFSGVCLEALNAGASVISFCQPMEGQIEKWHIVKTQEAMFVKAFELLKAPDGNTEKLVYRSMEEVAGEVLQLYE